MTRAILALLASVMLAMTAHAPSAAATQGDASGNWKKAGLLSVGGIPTRTAICATLSPIGGGASDTSTIQAAIDACPSGQVVKLNAGTFTIQDGTFVKINKSISVRGAGLGTTILTRTDGAHIGSYFPGANPSPMVRFGYANFSHGLPDNETMLTANAVQGATSITVANASAYSVGEMVWFDEASGAGWQPDPADASHTRQVWASPDYRVIWQKHNPHVDGDDFPDGQYPYDYPSAGCWFAACDRPNNEIKTISAISGNTITFDSPIMMDYRTSHQARIARGAWMLEYAGLEDMTVEYGDDSNVKFDSCRYCWAKRVESRSYLGSGFLVQFSQRTQLEEVYVHDPVWPSPGGGGYNIALSWGATEILVQNSISVKANKVMVVESAGAGSVFAYNYMDMGYISGQDYWVEAGINASHMVGSHHVLFEGNQTFNIESDNTHGNSIYLTYFRNYASGYRRLFTDLLTNASVDDLNNIPQNNGPKRAVGAMQYSRWMTYIGNVLGTPCHMDGWTYDYTGGGWTGYIFFLGWGNLDYDAGVEATTFRDSNYDYLTNSVQQVSNSCSCTPSSLYLTAAPSFFSGYTWPWVNPTGSTKLYTLPAKARYEAGTP